MKPKIAQIKKEKPKKVHSLTWWKKRADRAFSRHTRQMYADSQGQVTCYTCPRRDHWKNLQCGHFVPRQYLATRWDERNCRPQCYACNMLYGGQPSQFAANLQREYGPEIVDELNRKRFEVVKLYVVDYQKLIEKYEIPV